MFVFTTYRIEVIGSYRVSVPGPDVIAIDSKHAHIALENMGKGDHWLDTSEELDEISKSKVMLDSLIIPNKLQLN